MDNSLKNSQAQKLYWIESRKSIQSFGYVKINEYIFEAKAELDRIGQVCIRMYVGDKDKNILT